MRTIALLVPLLLATGLVPAAEEKLQAPAGPGVPAASAPAKPEAPAAAEPAKPETPATAQPAPPESREGGDLGMSILGNQEAPKALVIVPWKSSELGASMGIAPMLDDSRQPVDREVFLRALSYYEIRSDRR